MGLRSREHTIRREKLDKLVAVGTSGQRESGAE